MQYTERLQERRHDLEENMRRKADALAESGRTRLTRASEYLRENDARTIANDFGGYVKTHPLQSLAVGIGIGYLLTRLIRR